MENKEESMKYCKYCGQKILKDAILCIHCGRQVENLKDESSKIIINNSNESTNINSNTNTNKNGFDYFSYGKYKDKKTALILCLLGLIWIFGLHKFYEGKPLKGIIYLCTLGFCGIAQILAFIALLSKPNKYQV